MQKGGANASPLIISAWGIPVLAGWLTSDSDKEKGRKTHHCRKPNLFHLETPIIVHSFV